jgi:hypothetical protein
MSFEFVLSMVSGAKSSPQRQRPVAGKPEIRCTQDRYNKQPEGQLTGKLLLCCLMVTTG